MSVRTRQAPLSSRKKTLFCSVGHTDRRLPVLQDIVKKKTDSEGPPRYSSPGSGGYLRVDRSCSGFIARFGS